MIYTLQVDKQTQLTLRSRELEEGSIWSSIRMISGCSMLRKMVISLVGGGEVFAGVATDNKMIDR